MIGRMRSFRAMAGLLSLLAYIVAAVAHLTADIDAPHPEAAYGAAASSSDPDAHPQRIAETEKHCHECFSASESKPAQIVAAASLNGRSTWPLHDPCPAGG